MYGMVNKAIQDLLVNNYGESAWMRIREKSTLKDDFFVSMKSYPDEITFSLVASASEELGLSQEAILEAFGEYWILYTADEGYRNILNIYGKTLPEFLGNLNLLHEQITLVMPNLNPPKFSVEKMRTDLFLLTYESNRKGLKPMVYGLLIGLGKRFKIELSINELASTQADSSIGKYALSW
ncbi:MAG: hypothetical protein ACI93L_002359 [Cyclobacteriaceae bacterium]|jgi:hypothetical protein